MLDVREGEGGEHVARLVNKAIQVPGRPRGKRPDRGGVEGVHHEEARGGGVRRLRTEIKVSEWEIFKYAYIIRLCM